MLSNDTKTPLISIVIPSYNHGAYIEKTLRSLLSQSYKNWEAVIVDNNSTDNTDAIFAKFFDPRFRFLKINNNGIIAKSRNLGIMMAQGQWIAFLDSDDFWDSDKLEKCSLYFDTADFIYHKLRLTFDSHKVDRSIRSDTGGKQFGFKPWKDLITLGNSIATSSVIINKEILNLIGGFDESPLLVAAEDFDLWVRISKNTNKFKFLPICLGAYLLNPSSMSKKNMGSVTLRVIKKYDSELSIKEYRSAISIVRFIRGRYFFRKEYYFRSFLNFIYCLSNAPFWIRLKSIINIILIPFYIINKSRRSN